MVALRVAGQVAGTGGRPTGGGGSDCDGGGGGIGGGGGACLARHARCVLEKSIGTQASALASPLPAAPPGEPHSPPPAYVFAAEPKRATPSSDAASDEDRPPAVRRTLVRRVAGQLRRPRADGVGAEHVGLGRDRCRR